MNIKQQGGIKIGTIKRSSKKMKNLILGIMLVIGLTGCTPTGTVGQAYDVGTAIESRQISFENITGEKGAAGKAADKELGVGRKGSASRILKPGKKFVLCDIDGPGVIRHIWMTMKYKGPATGYEGPEALQGPVIRVYWDNQTHPSIEAPVGPFFGLLHGQASAYQSAVHAVHYDGKVPSSLNTWLQMPFKKHAKMEIVNESSQNLLFFYEIDYTIGDTLPHETGYLHAIYRRENPTTLKQDFEILPKREGKGRFLGCILGIRTIPQVTPGWWGEGEVKMYLDGDEEFPTICGTGSEDYAGQGWGLQKTAYLYTGTILQRDSLNTIYRWHIKDPIYWKKDIRITIQQIGYTTELYERQDDWSACSFWYEPVPSKPLPQMPDLNARLKDYMPEKGNTDK